MKNGSGIGDILKTVGTYGLSEAENYAGSAVLGTMKTLKESSWEKKVLLGGLVGNLAAHVLDMDLPFLNLGMDSMVGIDNFIDNASDVAMGVAAASLLYKTTKNIDDINKSDKSVEDIIAEMFPEEDDSQEIDLSQFTKEQRELLENIFGKDTIKQEKKENLEENL